jgi:outer membrane receptor protein involved in Fe transport
MNANATGRFIAALVIALCAACGPALAGTTGGISGRVIDAAGSPVAGVKITVSAPSQTSSGVSDAKGFFSILNLTPDTFTITASKDGFDTSQLAGITVQADQTASATIAMRPTVKVLTTVTATAVASVVNKSVTGDLYAVNAQAINKYQGAAGGAETLYSQNGVVGSLPGVVRAVGTGGGYAGNGSLSVRGGSNDQIGFELEGIPLNRGFDSANATSFVTNGLGSLEVYTGGAPADSGRSMAGFINEVMHRGTYPGGGDLTFVGGFPTFNHTFTADMYGGTPDRRFTYYVSTLGSNADYNLSNRANLDNQVLDVAANDPGCLAFNTEVLANTDTSIEPSPLFLNCATAHHLNIPISQHMFQSLANPSAAERDTVINLHQSIAHGGLNDDLQAMWVGGSTGNPFPYAGTQIDPVLYAEGTGGSTDAAGNFLWPTGTPYTGALNQPYNPASFGALTWPSAGNSQGPIPKNYIDSQATDYGINKLSYTRAFSSSSFLRLYAYALYSTWNFDQATNGFVGDSYYQLHDHATGYTMNYQNQLTQHHLLRLDVDYSKDLTLRYNYAPNFAQDGFWVQCGTTLSDPDGTQNLSDIPLGACDPATNPNVLQKGSPFAYWNALPLISTDGAIADSWRPSDKWLFDIGARFDRFHIPLTALQVTGANGLAEMSQNQAGFCLHGYAYLPGEPCNGFLTAEVNDGNLGATALPGAGKWTNVSGSLDYNEFSPRFGVTFTASASDVFRFSVGRYVEPPATAYIEYIGAPVFGANDTVSVLNNFYDGLGFTAVHNVQPQDSTNFDLSFEHDFNNGWSAKVTPYARNTRGQILSLPVVPTNPTFVTGYNFGSARIHGAEFLISKQRSTPNGWSAVVSATYTDSKIHFDRTLGGQSFIDVINASISAYNGQYGTHYSTLDPNGYYSPSLTQSPGSTSPSYDVRLVANINLDYRLNGWDFAPTFTYQSGNPYGDPLSFPDVHCQPAGTTSVPGCTALPATAAGPLANGPDPYTNSFDQPGSLKGPSWLSMNMAVSRDLAQNIKASFLVTNIFTVVHNHGYPWEFPTKAQVLAYGDNSFYTFPLGMSLDTGFPTHMGYYGDNYHAYVPASLNSAPEFVFSLSTKL